MSKHMKNMVLKKMMSCYAVLFLLIIVDINGVWSISREEDLELERQLKILNKPGVKTIRTDFGQTFDCVDIHKQPSLDHPLLKNHKIRMPTFDDFPKSIEGNPLKRHGLFGFDLACPVGTVPIRRIRKEDLIRAKAFSKLHMKTYAKNSHPLADAPIHISAKVAANDIPIYGVVSRLNVYAPALSSPDQVSGSIVYLSTGLGDDSKSVVSVGWAVMPPVYHDNSTHLFAYWTADNGKTTGCYDILCPGFIQQSNVFTLGQTLPGSYYHGEQLEIAVLVAKDPSSGDWYLRVNGASVGYWPKEILNFEVAKELNWGGEIFTPRQPCPPMGSGHFDGEGMGGACYISNMKYQKSAGANFEDIDPHVKALVDSPQCYKASMPTNLGEYIGYTFFFGGPGGQC